MTVVATASDDSPALGEAVTLTAESSAPACVTYQWQKWTDGAWMNVGAASTLDVSQTSRGTGKYRVEISHTTAETAKSAPVYVTWDEWAIVTDMVTELSAAVA